MGVVWPDREVAFRRVGTVHQVVGVEVVEECPIVGVSVAGPQTAYQKSW